MFATASRKAATIEDACEALREADRLTAEALSIIARTDVEAATGLPAEMMLSLRAQRTSSDARMLVNAAATLRNMPYTAAAFARGVLSWGQVRAIVSAVRWVGARGRDAIDDLIERTQVSDPDELLARVDDAVARARADDAVARARADLSLAREDRQIESSFFAIQGRLDGSASFYGEADAGSTATLLEALDSAADRPVAPEEGDAPTRAQQRFDALISICEQSLNGGRTGTRRPRPRFVATIDIDAFVRNGLSESARVLWSLAGRPARLTPLATETTMCDATIVPVVFDGGRPVAVGDAAAPISPRLRTALVARDGGCRFPGCRAPAAWCDAHHIRARIHGGPTSIDNLLLLCRRCHRRVHRHRWRIRTAGDDLLEFTRRGHTYTSGPRARSTLRE